MQRRWNAYGQLGHDGLELRWVQEARVAQEFELGADGVEGAVGGCGFDAHGFIGELRGTGWGIRVGCGEDLQRRYVIDRVWLYCRRRRCCCRCTR